MSAEQSHVEDAQQREILNRLKETDADPRTLEAFEENDLERMIRAAMSDRANPR